MGPITLSSIVAEMKQKKNDTKNSMKHKQKQKQKHGPQQ